MKETCPPSNSSHEKDSKALISSRLDSWMESLSTHHWLELDINLTSVRNWPGTYLSVYLTRLWNYPCPWIDLGMELTLVWNWPWRGIDLGVELTLAWNCPWHGIGVELILDWYWLWHVTGLSMLLTFSLPWQVVNDIAMETIWPWRGHDLGEEMTFDGND
jgi:hypothetical protein